MTYATTKTLITAHPTVDTAITLDSDSEGAIAYPHPVTQWFVEVDFAYGGETLRIKTIVDDSEVVGGNPYAVSRDKLIERMPSSLFDEVFAAWYDDSETVTTTALDSDGLFDSTQMPA